jgi:hypothetical protein
MEEQNKSQFFKVKGEELVKKVKELVAAGNARKIIIKDTEGKTFLEIPLTVGVVGAVFAPVLAAVGALAALVGNFTIELVKKDDNTKDTTPEK